MIDDWTGHKYITSHRCFGQPCPKDMEGFVQMRDDDTSDEDEDDEQ